MAYMCCFIFSVLVQPSGFVSNPYRNFILMYSRIEVRSNKRSGETGKMCMWMRTQPIKCSNLRAFILAKEKPRFHIMKPFDFVIMLVMCFGIGPGD